MKKILFFLAISCAYSATYGQTTHAKPAILLGSFGREQLTKAPFNEWFDPNYSSYNPDSGTVSRLLATDKKGISIKIFLGTWCGDSRREVPGFLKILDRISFPDERISIIGLGASDSLYKQSPGHEEAGQGIFRVPVFMILKNGKEINRINEYPSMSLEKDLALILEGKAYYPNYPSFDILAKWEKDGTLADRNISPRSLAGKLRSTVTGENELNSLGYLWLAQGRKDDALRIFLVNAILFPGSANVLSSLGEGYLQTGNLKNAVNELEKSLVLNKDPALVREILDLLYQAKGLPPNR
jgi:tetratricopeptide (TPR) repeat protein